MARYVLLEFDDNNDAQEFIRSMDSITGDPNYRVVGLFVRPTKFCQCGPLTELQQRDETRGDPRTGIYYHKKCKLPRKMPLHTKNVMMLVDEVGLSINMGRPY